MSLLYKISTLLIAVFVLFGIFTYTVQQLVILPSFLTLETQDAQMDMERAEQAIQREIAALAQAAGDWASWNDTYRFIEDKNSEFRLSTLTRIGVLDQLRVDLLYFVDVAGNVVWSVVYNRQTGEKISLQELSDKALPPDHPLMALPSETSTTKGLLSTTFGPLMVVSKPSLDSNSEGPSHGALVLGRFLDPPTIRRIAKQARVELTVWSVQGAALGTEQAAVAAELGDSGESAIRANDSENRIYQILPDIFGKPALLLQVKVPRLISAEGSAAIRNARISLAAGALLILLVLLVGLRYLVLVPIAQLIMHADEVGRRDDLSIRLDTDRRDELGVLAREFNQMVERLADARKALLEQAHQAGIAELASGVLHNIGNAITPLKVRVANLESTLREAPVAELEMALTELGDSGTPDQRRTDLREFTDLAAREFATLVSTTVEQIVDIAHQVDHVQKILSDQEKVSRAARVLQPVEIAELVQESVALLGTDLHRAIQVEFDPSLQTVGRVLASPVALQQILINLLKNAAESIRVCTPAPEAGRIEVSAAQDSRDARAMIRLRVSDNGAGIAPEDLSRLFERGFSTKSRPSSGQGLHWCSVTAAALGGQITIDSAGTGHGASVSLWLPQA